MLIIYKEPSQAEIKQILSNNKTIAIVGCSNTHFKAAHEIPKFLIEKGYKVIPVNPNSEEILGQKTYKEISEVEEEVDIVDIFRPSAEVLSIVKKAISLKPKVIWMQLGIQDQKAAELAEKNNIRVVMDKCLEIEYKRLL